MRFKFVLGLVIMLAIAFYGYSWQVKKMATVVGASTPAGIIDAVGVKMDLLSIAGAEQQQFALESTYLTLDQLRAKGMPIPERRGRYVFTAELTGGTFLVRARYEMPAGGAPSADFIIGPDMKVKESTDARR